MRLKVTAVVALLVGVAVLVAASQPVSAVGKVAPSGRLCFAVDGAPGGAAVVNLTPVRAEGAGDGQLISSDVSNVPVASNVNYRPGSIDPNVAVATVGADGQVCYVNAPHAAVDLIADHLGTIDGSVYRAAGSGAPVRTLDTRTGLGGGRVGPRGRVCFGVAGAPGDAALVNLTPVRADATGDAQLVSSNVTVPPLASNVNYAPGSIDPNVAVATIGADGRVCFVNSDRASVDVIADHLGTIDASAYRAASDDGAPVRAVDTRGGGGKIRPAGRVCFVVAGSPGDAALVNLTPVQGDGVGDGQLVSSDVTSPPTASNVNYRPGSIDPNVAIAPIGADGRVCFVNAALTSVHLIADHLGTVASDSFVPANPDAAPRRVVDTRDWRPDVYLNYHGSEQLLGPTDSQWTYVREHLDGFWGHWSSASDHATQIANTIELTRKVVGRRLVAEHAIADGGNGSCLPFMEDYFYGGVPGVPKTGVEGQAPDIRYERVAAGLYAGLNPNCWGAAGGIGAAFSEYQGQGYETVYSVWQAPNLITVSDPNNVFPRITPGSSGDAAYRGSGGVVVECQMDDCLHPTVRDQFFRVIEETHARGQSFVWFTGYDPSSGIGTSGWLAKIQRTYDAITQRGLWRPGDAVTVINYFGSYPALPERRPDGTPADTVTGVLAWLLEQRPSR